MHLARFLIPADLPLQKGQETEIQGAEARHLARVLRARRGQDIELIDGCCRLARARVIWSKPERVGVEILNVKTMPDDRVPVNLITGLLKAEKMDLLIQKTAEIGIKSIRPVLTEYTVPKIREPGAGKKIRRWRQIARQALKQCRGVAAMDIYPVSTLKEALSQVRGEGLPVVLDHTSDAPNLLDVLCKRACNYLPVYLVVGAEGGLSPQEVETCYSLNFLPASLGSRILRAETAAIAAAAVTQLFINADRWKM